MRSVGKAAEILRKAAAALRGKAGVLRARLLFLASLRRRAAVLAGISRHVHALAPGRQGKEKVPRGRVIRAPAPAELADVDDEGLAAPAAGTHDDVVGMAELAGLFREVDEDGDGGYPDWTLTLQSLFDDDDEEESHGGGGDLAAVEAALDDDDEPSVIDVIRSRRKGEGREFRMEDEIDQAADMFITRIRRRMMSSQPALGVSGFH